jgi:hypothetical protein
MNPYSKYLDEHYDQYTMMEEILELLSEGKTEEATRVANKIMAIRDVKLSLIKLDNGNK